MNCLKKNHDKEWTPHVALQEKETMLLSQEVKINLQKLVLCIEGFTDDSFVQQKNKKHQD